MDEFTQVAQGLLKDALSGFPIDLDEPSVSKSTTSYSKFPLKRLEPTIQKFIKILEIDLERLNRHKINIQKFKALSEWRSLHREHINSSRTVQQLKANIREMEKTRHQIKDEDVAAFDAKVENIRSEAMTKVIEFLEVYNAPPESTNNDEPFSMPVTHAESLEAEDAPLVQLQQEKQLQDDIEFSWNQLQDDLLELNGLMRDFSQAIHAQGQVIDSIEDNVETAHENVSKGAGSLAKAAKYKAAIFPVAGALIGGAIGGPVGLMAGLKLGVASAVGGSIIGFTGGTFLKKRQVKSVDMEMKKLQGQNSTSLPEDLDKIS